MKKSIILAFAVMLTASLSAQHVSPVTFSLTTFNLDSLRKQYQGQSYMMELQRLDKLMKDDTKQLKDAQNQLKAEQDYYKQMSTFADKAESSIKNMQSLAQKDLDELNNLKELTDKLLRSTSSNSDLGEETHTKITKALLDQRLNLDSAINATTVRQTVLSRHPAQIRLLRTDLMVFNGELTNKSTDLKQLEATLKSNRDIIKSEIKNVKSQK